MMAAGCTRRRVSHNIAVAERDVTIPESDLAIPERDIGIAKRVSRAIAVLSGVIAPTPSVETKPQTAEGNAPTKSKTSIKGKAFTEDKASIKDKAFTEDKAFTKRKGSIKTTASEAAVKMAETSVVHGEAGANEAAAAAKTTVATTTAHARHGAGCHRPRCERKGCGDCNHRLPQLSPSFFPSFRRRHPRSSAAHPGSFSA
jgi:hypothetical protein